MSHRAAHRRRRENCVIEYDDGRIGRHCYQMAPGRFYPPRPMTPRRFYYVSAINGGKRGLMAGPYPNIIEAMDKVDAVSHRAAELEPRAWFWAWGTAGSGQELKTPVGVEIGRAAGRESVCQSG